MYYKSSGGGADKDKLMPYFSPQECAGLHTCFLKDIAGQCQKTQADLYICYTPDDKGAALKNIFGDDKIYFPQMGNLGRENVHGNPEFLPKIMDPVC